MRRIRITIIIVIVVLLIVHLSTSVLGNSPNNPVITTSGCTLTIEFTADLDADYRTVVYDDLMTVLDQTVTAQSGQPLSFTHVFGEVGPVAPGIAIEIYRNGQLTFSTYEYTAIVDSCDAVVPPPVSEANPCAASILAGAVGGLIIQETPFFYGPSHSSRVPLDLTLEAGKTVDVIGVDAANGFYQIVFACNYFWLPVEVIAPNPDAVWNGAPLDVRLIE